MVSASDNQDVVIYKNHVSIVTHDVDVVPARQV